MHEKYYEETLDWNLHKLLPEDLRIEKVKAFPITKPRLIGDIGLRGYFQLRSRALQLLKSEQFEFIYIPIPSFYVALLGPYLKKKTGVNYGIDYIDPWVHDFPGSDRLFTRHWFSKKLASVLEPIAVKHASLITGVSKEYYLPTIDRNPFLENKCKFAFMPYGAEVSDVDLVKQLYIKPYLFRENKKIKLVYAGAMLPKAVEPLEYIFKSIALNLVGFENVEFYFIGTGKTSNDPNGFNIKQLAEKYNLWNTVVFEFPKRISYVDVLVHLNNADGVFILGSTESHYTPSKVFQAILSKKPILAVLNQNSSAVNVIERISAGIVLTFNNTNVSDIATSFYSFFDNWKFFIQSYVYDINKEKYMQEYSAENSSKTLAQALNQIV